MKEERKRERKLLSNRVGIKTKRRLTLRQKTFANLVPLSPSLTQAALDAGYSKRIAGQVGCENMKKSNIINEVAKVERNLKEHLNAKGMDDSNIADRIINYINYNSEEVERGGNEGGKVVVEMRDSRGVANMLTNVVKFKGASLENTASNIISEVNSETAWLAIKSLVRKLSVDQVKELRDSCEAMLESSSKIVAEA